MFIVISTFFASIWNTLLLLLATVFDANSSSALERVTVLHWSVLQCGILSCSQKRWHVITCGSLRGVDRFKQLVVLISDVFSIGWFLTAIKLLSHVVLTHSGDVACG